LNDKKLLLGVSAIALGAALSMQAHAQTATTAVTTSTSAPAAQPSAQLSEVTVTAERRRSSVQKTALSIAVRNGDELAREGRYTTAQILEDVPGVTVTGPPVGDNPGDSIVIRGVAPDAVPIGDSSVATTAVYVDGVNSGIGGDFDIDRVEVLRGPQGTLYGRSATGGVVSTYTRDPVLNKLGGFVNVEVGSYDLRHITAAVNVPLINDMLALRVAGNEYDQNGFISSRGGSQEHTEARAKLLYQPTPDLSVLAGFAIDEERGHTGGEEETLAEGGPNTFVYTPSTIYPTKSQTKQYWGLLNWNLGFGTLTYIPTYHNIVSPVAFSAFVNPFFQQSLTNANPLDQITTQEVRLASDEGSPVTWIGGAYYYNRLYKFAGTTTWEPQNALVYSQSIDKSTTNVGTFGEVTYPFLDTFKATGGLRWDYTRIRSDLDYVNNDNTGCDAAQGGPFCGNPNASSFGVPPDLISYTVSGPAGVRTEYNVTYKARLEDDFTPDNLAYAMVSTGFLPGDISVSVNGTPLAAVAFNYKPEELTSYEVGGKNRFLDNSVQVNGDFYYYDYSSYQQFVNTSHSPAPQISVIGSPARMWGAELETLWRITPNDRLGASLGYVDAWYTDKPANFAPFVSQTTIPGIVPFTVQGNFDHTIPLPDGSSVLLHADARYASSYDEGAVAVDQIAYGAEPYVRQGPTVIGDLSVGWNSAGSKYSVTGYVNNVADRIYKTGTFISSAGPSPPNGAIQVATSTSPSNPRVFGVVLHAAY